ncbi:MAG: phospho-sugar mutase [Acidimicrobiia bacterium]|nr:MAG: phospho-sugar mutase [Acidimicrobiia bacterium]
MSEIDTKAREWMDGDPDRNTRSELAALLASGDTDELADRMAGVLPFGTAGIRGVVEAGSNRMNRATVIRTTAGLAAHLVATTEPEDRLIAVGRDARPSSAAFMEDTVGVLTAAGFDVRYFADPTPTPLVAYAGITMGACASIVITASHNPPKDNGYKVYAVNGAQIISPADAQIAAAIAQVGPANAVPRSADAFGQSGARPIGPELFEDYLRAVHRSLPSGTSDRDIRIVYTAMHGVGGRFVVDALQRFGYSNVHPVAAQFEPDGTFPTVDFPNPEEPGALDLAHELAQALDADLVLANDPDTDRLAVSVPDPGGAWRPLTGNQIGSLLAEYLLGNTDRGMAINSIVSSPLLGVIADRHGATWAQTLTGFKWVWNAALDLSAEGHGDLTVGYEEALGYSIGTTVRDKDGISAAVAFATLAGQAAAEGKTVLDTLGDLYRRYGVWVSAQVSIRREGASGSADIAAAMDALRSDHPESLAGFDVVGTTDFSKNADTRPRYLGATNLIELDLGTSGRVLARPSGTEPKLKIYVDLSTAFPESGDWIGAEYSLIEQAGSVGAALESWLIDAMES